MLRTGAANFSEAVRMACEVYATLKKAIIEKYGKASTSVGDEVRHPRPALPRTPPRSSECDAAFPWRFAACSLPFLGVSPPVRNGVRTRTL